MNIEGIVKIDNSVLATAVLNYKEFIVKAKAAYRTAHDLAEVDLMEVSNWIFFKKKITVEEGWGYCDSWMCYSYTHYLANKYPKIFTQEQCTAIYGCQLYDSVKALYEANGHGVYLNPHQAAWVTKWSKN